MHSNNSSIAVKKSGLSTRLRNLGLAIVGAAVLGAGANAAAPADAQAYPYLADYHIYGAMAKADGRFTFTVRNSGATTSQYSWISVRDGQGRVIAWYGKTGMAAGTEWRDGGYFPNSASAALVCADDWQNAIAEYNESNNCSQVYPWVT